MAGRIPCTLVNFVDDTFPSSAEQDRRDEEVESVGNESMKVNVHATPASDVLSFDDNNSVSQIDPGNFSESDIEDDGGSNCCLSLSDVLGGFPESDIEDAEEHMSECLSDAGISFSSDVGSPLHSSCRSYPVSEDRDDREETTPLPMHDVTPPSVFNNYQTSSHGRSLDYETFNDSEVSSPRMKKVDSESKISGRRLRSSAQTRKKLGKGPTQPKKGLKIAKKNDKGGKKAAVCGKRKALTVMRLLADDKMPLTTSFCSIPSYGSVQNSPVAKSLSIPILDLCITEDEGYLGMAEETSEDSEKEKDENQLPPELTDL